MFTNGILYEIYLPTYIPRNTLLGSVSASDADTGWNGQLNYFISSVLSDSGANDEVYVEEGTGNVFAARDIEKVEGDVFNLGLMAEDNAELLTDRRYGTISL